MGALEDGPSVELSRYTSYDFTFCTCRFAIFNFGIMQFNS
jgi:hypothetical protein